MSDEELDALFQRGAAAYPDEMPPAAWARMETKLDEAARTQHLRRKVGRFFAGELLLIALLLWQVARLAAPSAASKTSHHQPDASQVAAHTSAATSAKSSIPQLFTTATPDHATPALAPTTGSRYHLTTAPPAALATTASEPALAPATSRAAASSLARATSKQLVNASRKAAHLPTATPGKTITAGMAGWQASSRRRGKQPQLLTGTGGYLGRSQAKSARATTSLQEDELAQANSTSAGEPVALLDERVTALPTAPYSLPAVLRPAAAQQSVVDTAQPPRRRAPRPPYRVLVGLLAGPSFSGVRTAETARLGIDYGLTLEYRFSPRVRVRAGLLSSQKRYLAASTDYTAPTAWQWFAGTYDLTANCRITEIPLDLRYDVLQRPTYAVFTSVGFNSLLMRDERYSYDWTMNGQTFTKSAEVRKGSNHFLSVLNVSVGFEKALGQRWSAQVEPFWQFPLGGVGAGKVRLTSAGAAFSLKFGLVR
jgi:hypothetical protein